jgi:hypothetical protein
MAGFGALGADRSGSVGSYSRISFSLPRAGPAWQIAFHRFAEVSIGIGVALVLTVVWPEREVALPNKT